MHEPSVAPGSREAPSGVAAGVAIAAASLLSVLGMAQHPSIQSQDVAGVFAEIGREAGLNALVHGVMIAAVGALIFGFSVFADRLGLHRTPVRLALVAYLMGGAAMVGAALISGFITPGFATHAGENAADLLMHQVLAWGGHANQALARLGVVGMSLGILGWSLALLGRSGADRLIGALGVAVGAIPPLGLLSGHLHLHVHGMGAVVLGQTIWNVAVVAQLVRGRV